ncbi:Putative membrane protein, clustering with ActP [Nocardiopsis sp. JB363]|nr:Putative membrane protein, clustering with ActP [Nocardiopsis sp. JB363]
MHPRREALRVVVHPRVRGEQSKWERRYWAAQGPSPRARGADVSIFFTVGHDGSIPACAGSRVGGGNAGGGDGVHPRVRGEQE